MTAAKKARPTSPDLLGAEQAIKRAARRAREIAIQTNTPCIVRKDGKLVDIAKQPGAITN
jgi:hypothetical protein